MNAPRYRHLPIPALLIGLLLWTTGCDVARIDEGHATAVDQLVVAVEEATDPDEAETALRQLMNRTGLYARADGQEGTFGAYAPDADALKRLAQRQAAFNGGDLQVGTSARAVYERIKVLDGLLGEIHRERELMVARGDRPELRADLPGLLAVHQAHATQAREHPDSETAALLLAIAGVREAEGPITALRPDQLLSPYRSLLLGVWLHRDGPFAVSPFGDGSKDGDDYRGETPCCGAEPSPFTSLTMQYIGESEADVKVDIVVPPSQSEADFLVYDDMPPGTVFTIDGAGRDAQGNGLDGTIGNEIALHVDGEFNSQMHTSCSQVVLPGDIYGELFKVIAVTTRTGGVCEADCASGCVAQYVACLAADGNPSECAAQYAECNSNCHDQGGGESG